MLCSPSQFRLTLLPLAFVIVLSVLLGVVDVSASDELPTEQTPSQTQAASESSTPFTVTTTIPVWPVLLGNEQSPLVRITIDVGRGTGRLSSLSFTLQGTEEPEDVASWQLFATGEQDGFSPAHLVAELSTPTEPLTFRLDVPLSMGKNVYWLSCRLKETADWDRHIAARCVAVETSLGKEQISVTDRRSKERHDIGVALRTSGEDGIHTSRIPALTITPAGTLLCVYDLRRRTGRDLQEDIDIGLSRSTDGGRHWGPARVIMDMGEFGGLPQAENGCSDPGIIVDHQTGEIFCFALWMHGKPGKHQWREDGSEPGFELSKTAQMMLVRSRDDGITWSQPQNLTRVLKQEAWWLFAPSPQQGLQLPDGTLVMPVQGRDETGTPFATIMSSRNHGDSWKVGEFAYREGNECQVALLNDGRLMLNMRNDRERYRAIATTSDLGQTWQTHATSRQTLIEPNCNASLLRVHFKKGNRAQSALLFANPHSQQTRTHHTIQVSLDDGNSWPDSFHHLIDEGRGAGYASLVQIDEQHVGLVYEGSQAQLVFQRFRIGDLIPTTDR